MGATEDVEFEVVWAGKRGQYLCIPEEPVKSSVLEEFEETALMGCKAVREFLTYRGDNKTYMNVGA